MSACLCFELLDLVLVRHALPSRVYLIWFARSCLVMLEFYIMYSFAIDSWLQIAGGRYWTQFKKLNQQWLRWVCGGN